MELRDIRSLHHDHRTLADTFNGESVWVKYAVVPLRPFSSTVFNTYSRLSNAPIFRSTHNPNAIDALRAEATRMRELERKGYLVPHIFDQSDKHLVLSDIGTCLSVAIEKEQDIERRRDLYRMAAAHLGRLHKNGDYHGRSVTKDLTVQNGTVGMIDLEHEPLKVMPLRDAQTRDVWYLNFSAAKHHREDPDLLPAILRTYHHEGPSDILPNLKDAVGLMIPATSTLRTALKTLGLDNYACKVADMNETLLGHLKKVPHKAQPLAPAQH